MTMTRNDSIGTLGRIFTLALLTGLSVSAEAQKKGVPTKTPIKPATTVPVAPAPAPVPVFVAPKDPAMPEGEAVMLATTTYKTAFDAAAKRYVAQPAIAHDLPVYDEKVAEGWVKTAAVDVFGKNATTLASLASQSAPTLDSPTSQAQVDAAYARNAARTEAGQKTAVDIITAVNAFAANAFGSKYNIVDFLTQAAAFEESKTRKTSPIRDVLKTKLVVDLNDPLFGPANDQSPAKEALRLQIAITQLKTLGAYLTALVDAPNGIAKPKNGFMGALSAAGKAATSKPGAPHSNGAWLYGGTPTSPATAISNLADFVNGALNNFDTAVKQNASPAPAVVPAPKTSLMVIPGDFGDYPKGSAATVYVLG